MPNMSDYVRDERRLEYHKFGTFSIQDFVRIQETNPHIFQLVHIYRKEDFGKTEEVKTLSESVEKRGLKFIESLVDQAT